MKTKGAKTLSAEKSKEKPPQKTVKEFIEAIADYIIKRISANSFPSLYEIYLEALRHTGKPHKVSSRIYGYFLLSQLRRLRDTLLDKAAEAISAHVDEIGDSPLYAELSSTLMRYALHELGLVQNIVTSLESIVLGEDVDNDKTELMEEFIFSAITRFLATMYVISSINTSMLEKMYKKIVEAINTFISEEMNIYLEKIAR
ncbi:hypothetical protein PYJP_03470 [Pyrofollis japonicus]|uniref:hypothetical protein n=1 Tax=Pyrofollis japonicus TaxID=3060460 RepID=UPI00295C3593|nr:hypothetical protein [Pyrofollis japonicus]BEP16995.1 hypothetical protein PYJP_03470 [Pyrofollis japonicus]